VIFGLGSGIGASNETSRFIRPLLKFLFPAASEELLQFYHGLIRKGAHLAEYGMLAFFAARVFLRSSRIYLKKYWYLAALWLVAAIAVADELNQSLSSVRTGSFNDVMIDIAGGIIMLAVLSLLKDRKPVRFLI
jgi:VanZ family protein